MKRKAKATKTWGSFDRAEGRKTALQALKDLRGEQAAMTADPSVSELSVNQFKYQLDSMADTISQVFPAPESISPAKLTGLFEGEA